MIQMKNGTQEIADGRSVYIFFPQAGCDELITIDGDFTADELREIANLVDEPDRRGEDN